MGTIADSLFNALMSWVRALVSSLWALVSSEQTTMLEFLGKNWIMIALVLIAFGLVVDWLIWLVRWQPYHLWARRIRRLLHLPSPEEEEAQEAELALRRQKRDAGLEKEARPKADEAYEEYGEEEPEWLPLKQPVITEQDEQQAMAQAQSVPDEALGAYPGMRYDAHSGAQDMQGTQRYAAVHSEGPGAAEVSRRRAEIDAWQLQMQEETQRKAEAERAAREEERARREREAYEAEQARFAQEAYEAEQARLAQEEYERQLAEYERQKAQYERDLAQYERKKAEYEAEMARRAAAQAELEAAQEIVPETESAAPARRRRAARTKSATYSDYVTGETVEQLPDPPAWPQMSVPETPKKRVQKAEEKVQKDGLLSKMAKLMEPEEEEISGVKALPPRVDMRDAYMPAKNPQKTGRRKR